MGRVNWLKLLISIVLCEGAGIVGGLFTFSAIPTWYATLVKPSFNPPSWLFGPVWTILYLLMGISLYLVWALPKVKKAKNTLILFAVHLLANTFWSIIFFGLKNPSIAFVEIIVLWILILAVMIKFYRLNKISSLILLPYFIWVSFASALNFTVWQLNK